MPKKITAALSGTRWHGTGWKDVSGLVGNALRRVELSASALPSTRIEVWASSDHAGATDYSGTPPSPGAAPPVRPSGRVIGTLAGPGAFLLIYPETDSLSDAAQKLANLGAQAPYYNFIRVSPDSEAATVIVTGDAARRPAGGNCVQIANLDFSGSGNTGPLGTAAETIECADFVEVHQETPGQTVAMPTPADPTQAKLVWVINTGSADFDIQNLVTGNSTSAAGSFLGAVWSPGTASWHT